MKTKLIQKVVIAVAVAAVLIGIAAMPAAADNNSYNPYSLCGFGYTTLAHREPIVAGGEDPLPAGTLYIIHNPTYGKYCAVSIKSRWVGVATDTMVGLVGGGPDASASGLRYYYGGPVYQTLWSDGCLAFTARITSPTGVEYWHESVNPAVGYGRYCP